MFDDFMTTVALPFLPKFVDAIQEMKAFRSGYIELQASANPMPVDGTVVWVSPEITGFEIHQAFLLVDHYLTTMPDHVWQSIEEKAV